MKLIIFSSVLLFYVISWSANTSKVGCYMSNHASISNHLIWRNPNSIFLFYLV